MAFAFTGSGTLRRSSKNDCGMSCRDRQIWRTAGQLSIHILQEVTHFALGARAHWRRSVISFCLTRFQAHLARLIRLLADAQHFVVLLSRVHIQLHLCLEIFDWGQVDELLPGGVLRVLGSAKQYLANQSL